MAVLTITSLEVGMELAERVTNSRGKVLFNRGAVITEKYLKALKAWGFTEVTIKDLAEETNASGNSLVVHTSSRQIDKEMQKEITLLFQKTDRDDPVVQELFRIAVERLVQGGSHE